MKMFIKSAGFFFACCMFLPGLFAQDAGEILQKTDRVLFSFKDKQANVEMILENRRDKEKIREAVLMQKGTEKRLYRYTKPESQAGIATLSLPGDIMWLYMPAFGRPKKISLLAKSQAFTGTDFSHEDMSVRSYAGDYTPTLLETTGETYILELVPKSGKSSYSKLVMQVDKDHYYPHRIEYYDKRRNKEKTATYVFRKTGDYWYAREVTMTDLKKDHATTIIMTDVIFDQGIPDETFTVEKMMPEEE